MASNVGTASGVFAVTARQFQTKAQTLWQGLKNDAATAAVTRRPVSIQDFIDPNTRTRLAARKKDTDSLVQKLSSGGDSAKEAAARKKEEAKQKLKMLKLQAQLAAASGDKKAAARIAKEAASVAKELGQAAKEAAGSAGTQTAVSGAGDTAAASAEAQAVAQQAGQIVNQADSEPALEQDTATADLQVAGEASAIAGVTPNETLQAQRDAIIRDGSARAAEAQEENELRNLMDQLRSVHQQMKNLARKDGSAGTKAEMERATQDMEEGDRAIAEAFGPPGTSLPVFAAPVSASVDIRA